MTAEQVAEQGYKAMMREKAIVIPGFYNKLLAISSTLSPDCLNNSISSFIVKQN
ncbi:MAG: hypothetical protein ACRCWR_09200 [Saezia sp.]